MIFLQKVKLGRKRINYSLGLFTKIQGLGVMISIDNPRVTMNNKEIIIEVKLLFFSAWFVIIISK